MKNRLPAVSVSLFASSATFAHSGNHQGSLLQQISHIWANVDHLAPGLAIGASLIIGAVLLAKRVSSRRDKSA